MKDMCHKAYMMLSLTHGDNYQDNYPRVPQMKIYVTRTKIDPEIFFISKSSQRKNEPTQKQKIKEKIRKKKIKSQKTEGMIYTTADIFFGVTVFIQSH